jgi:hypothetical protein
MERQFLKPTENSLGSSITFVRKTAHPASLHSYEGKLASDEEGVDCEEEEDKGQRGGGTNRAAPGFSRSPPA